MYYYIAEPLTSKTERNKIEEIKSILSQLGIAGEFTIASPARTVEEHLELAFKKGFTTLVGIGTDAIADRIASTMLRLQYDRAALGMIPLTTDQSMWSRIGARSLRDSCELLRSRFLEPIDVVQLNKTHAFVTNATITLSKPAAFHLTYKAAELRGQFTDLRIEHTGEVMVWDKTAKFNQARSFFERLFGQKSQAEIGITRLRANHWLFETDSACEVAVSGQLLTETPLSVHRQPKALKLIVARAKITSEKEATMTKEF